MATAMEWVSRVTTIALTMVLPGLAGNWLDGKLNTGFIALVGFALGITVAVWQLLQLAREANGRDQKARHSHSPQSRSNQVDQDTITKSKHSPGRDAPQRPADTDPTSREQ